MGIVEAITPVKPRGTPGAPSTPLLDPGSKKAAMFSTPTLTRDVAQAWIIVLGAWDQTFCAWQKIAQKSQKLR